MTKIPLDILSDPICPWCYIGKARLERAFAARPNHPFRVFWRPFQLNPDMAADGMDRTAYLHRKFGGAEGAARVYGAIEEAAKAENLPVDFAAIARTPSTLNAHRLLRWALQSDPNAERDAQGEICDGLFEAYFVLGRDISDPAVLSEIAGAAGLDAASIAPRLAGDDGRDDVTNEDAAARKAGVTGAPTFVVNGRHVVPGAQETPFWIGVIDDLTEALAEAERDDDGAARA